MTRNIKVHNGVMIEENSIVHFLTYPDFVKYITDENFLPQKQKKIDHVVEVTKMFTLILKSIGIFLLAFVPQFLLDAADEIRFEYFKLKEKERIAREAAFAPVPKPKRTKKRNKPKKSPAKKKAAKKKTIAKPRKKKEKPIGTPVSELPKQVPESVGKANTKPE